MSQRGAREEIERRRHDALLTPKQVCQMLGISRDKLRYWRRTKQIQVVKFGHCTIRIRESEVNRLRVKFANRPDEGAL